MLRIKIAMSAGHSNTVTYICALKPMRAHTHVYTYLLTFFNTFIRQVWDLETMGMIAQTPPETTAVRSMTFHPDGTHLFSAVQVCELFLALPCMGKKQFCFSVFAITVGPPS